MDQQTVEDLNGSTYQGSFLFGPVAEKAGLPIDQFNFLFSEVVALVLAILFRRFFPARPANTFTRHLLGKCSIHLFNEKILNICSVHCSECLRHCSRLFLFRCRNLSSFPSIIDQLPSSLSSSNETIASTGFRLLFALHECKSVVHSSENDERSFPRTFQFIFID